MMVRQVYWPLALYALCGLGHRHANCIKCVDGWSPVMPEAADHFIFWRIALSQMSLEGFTQHPDGTTT